MIFFIAHSNWLLFGAIIFACLVSIPLSTLLTHIPETLIGDFASSLEQPTQANTYHRVSFIGICTCLTGIIIHNFGFTWVALANTILSFGLVLLLYMDFRHYLLPDCLTLSLLWMGLFCNSLHWFVLTSDAIWGAMTAYLSLKSVAISFKYCRGSAGIGDGDIKLFALFGAWWGITPLLFLISFASFLGLLVGLLRMIKDPQSLQKPLAFGPYLILAGFFVMFFRSSFVPSYAGAT